MENKLTVFAIFDDGSSLGQTTCFRLPATATIRDAVDCFQNRSANMWKTTNVEFVGILSKEDLPLPYGDATASLALHDDKIQDVMEPRALMVFLSAGNEADNSDDESSDVFLS